MSGPASAPDLGGYDRILVAMSGGKDSVADQWATMRWLAPELFARIAAYEGRFGCTIQRGRTVTEVADRGRPFAAALAQPELARRAMQPGWSQPALVRPDLWTLPAGATGDTTGPT